MELSPSPIKPVEFAAPAGWTDRLDMEMIRLLYRKETALLREDPQARGEAARLTSLLEAKIAVRRRLVASKGLSEFYMPGRLILLLTHACQLRCTYCRVAKFSSNMSVDTVYKGVELLMTSPRREIQLQFFGGDPLLRYDLIEKAVGRTEELRAGRGLDIRYMLTTNGQALDARKLRFFKKHDFLLEFSFDGDAETFRSQRPGVGGRDFYERIRSNLAALQASGIPYYCIAVATPESVGSLYKNFRGIAALGHERIQVNYQLGHYWSPESQRELILQMARCAAYAARTPGLEFINATRIRREPTVLNSELVVDTDGGVYRETGICLEEDFQRQKSDFFLAPVGEAGGLRRYPASPFDNFHLLSEIYGRRSRRFRKIILSNIQVGYAVDRWVRGMRRHALARS